MPQIIAAAPIRKTIVVKAETAQAFAVFAHRMHDWSPAVQSLLGARRDIVIEPFTGGRWYEVNDDGSEADWGKVLAWDPPNRMLLAWQLNAQFAYDPQLITEVEACFFAESGGRTRVEFEHRNLDRFGADAAATRSSLDGEGGWSGSFALFEKLLNGNGEMK